MRSLTALSLFGGFALSLSLSIQPSSRLAAFLYTRLHRTRLWPQSVPVCCIVIASLSLARRPIISPTNKQLIVCKEIQVRDLRLDHGLVNRPFQKYRFIIEKKKRFFSFDRREPTNRRHTRRFPRSWVAVAVAAARAMTLRLFFFPPFCGISLNFESFLESITAVFPFFFVRKSGRNASILIVSSCVCVSSLFE